jgi:hypothetical protein
VTQSGLLGRRRAGARDQDIEELDRKLLLQFQSANQLVQACRPVVKPLLGAAAQGGCGWQLRGALGA